MTRRKQRLSHQRSSSWYWYPGGVFIELVRSCMYSYVSCKQHTHISNINITLACTCMYTFVHLRCARCYTPKRMIRLVVCCETRVSSQETSVVSLWLDDNNLPRENQWGHQFQFTCSFQCISSFTSEKSFYEGEARVRLRNIKKTPKTRLRKSNNKQQEYTKC